MPYKKKTKKERQAWWKSLSPEQQKNYIDYHEHNKRPNAKRDAQYQAYINSGDAAADQATIQQWRIEQAIEDKITGFICV
jgi:hypothetical protein